MIDQLDEAISWLQRSVEADPELAMNDCVLASACGLASHDNEAAALMSEYRRRRPSMTISQIRALPRSNNPAYLAWSERFYHGLRNAGLPE